MKRILLSILTMMIGLSGISGQTVGVVLSGGGAKGMAHVGLLKMLEENNIPIDYICGTSMGAIIGSLYAIGYTPDQMAEFMQTDEFLRWSKGEITPEEEYYYKNKRADAEWVSIDIKREKGGLTPILPTNLIAPEQMDFRFMQIYAKGSARAEYDFSKLFVPFFCVASDVHGNKPVILTSGNLSQAVRASMTFPGYFKPLMIDSVLLFDGGMQNNFPSDILEQMYHPDVIIGCTVTENPEKPTTDDAFLMLMNVFMKKSDFSIPGKGVLIAPKLSQFSLMDFDKFNEVEQIGYNASLEKLDSIKMLVSRRVDPDSLARRRAEFVGNSPDLVFGDVVVNGVNEQAASYIEQSIKRGKDTFSFKSLEKTYFRLTSDKMMQSIYPQAFFNPSTGHYDLHLEVSAKNALTMKFGGNLSSGNRSFGQIGAEYVFMHRSIYAISGSITAGQFYNSAEGVFRIDLSPRNIAERIPPFFVDFRAAYSRWNYFKTSNELFFDSEALSQVINTDKYIGVDFGSPTGNRGIATIGAAYGSMYYNYFQSTSINKNDEPDETQMNYLDLKLNYEYSTLNYRQYANKGRSTNIQACVMLGDESYKPGTTARPYESARRIVHYRQWVNLSAQHTKYFSLAKHFSLGCQIMLNIGNKPNFSNSISSLLTAYPFNPFPQCQSQILEKFRAVKWIGLGLMPIINITERIQFRNEIHAFQAYRYISTANFIPSYSDKFPIPRFMQHSALVWHTPIGPLSATGSYFYKEEKPFRFQISFGYMLFNRRGTE